MLEIISKSIGFNLENPECDSYLLIYGETNLSNSTRAILYLLGLAYCFIGLSAITAKFFHSMENIMRQTKQVVRIDPCTNLPVVKNEKFWNYTIADITLLAFGTSFPQISLATIDAIRNIGQLTAGGLSPGTLVGSAAFDLFPIHAVCVVVPKAGSLKKISDLGVWIVELFWSFWAYIWLYIILEVWTPNVITLWESLLTVLQFGLLLLHAYAQDKRWPYLSIPFERGERPEDWVPKNNIFVKGNEDYDDTCEILDVSERGQRPQDWVPKNNISVKGNEDYDDTCEILDVSERSDDNNIVDIFSVHSYEARGAVYQNVPSSDVEESSRSKIIEEEEVEVNIISIWRQQFFHAIKLENVESRKTDRVYKRVLRIVWHLMLLPWRIMFAFVPPYQIAQGWLAFICSLVFISGIAYLVTKLTDQISYVTGINPYVIAFTALASGTSWPDLVASKIAAERQVTADSAIANITCSNSVNIYVGIGVPWLIDTVYNYFMLSEPLYINNAAGLSFSILVFFATSAGCIVVLVLRRLIFGAELGGPRLWAWATSVYFIILWLIFVVLSSLKVSGII